MENKNIEKFVKSVDSMEKAWDKFSELNLESKKSLFIEMFELAISAKHTNRAVVLPNAASVITRQLNPGVEFKDWYQEWLPPVAPQTVGKEVVRDYFSVPTRVINLRGIKDDKTFLTIGFVYNPYDSVEELLNARPKDVKINESKRRDTNKELLAKSEVELYSVASDDIFGL